MTQKFNKYFCQHCGCQSKWVETIIDDKFTIDENGKIETVGFSDEFEHTGKEICVDCSKDWTGAPGVIK